MPIEITVPRLGWSMDEGTLTEWLKRDGDYVRKGDMLFVLEGDKASQEVECFDEGILRILPAGPRSGDSVQVGQLLAYLVAEGEPAPWNTSEVPAESATGRLPATPVAATTPVLSAVDVERPQLSRLPASTRSSPRARRRATELGVDWTSLMGTGKAGRIRERDVLAAIAGHDARVATDEPKTAMGQPLSPTRRLIAERMLTSHLSTAPVTLTSAADATNLVSLREQFKTAAANSDGVVPSVTDFVVKLTAIALQAHPALNAQWHEDGIVMSSEIHMGIAVDTDSGLVVPVVRNVERLTLRELAAKTRELIEQARSRRLPVRAMQEGTFTVTNLGTFGIDAFTPLIQLPQCAILGIGRIHTSPAFIDNQVVPRERITLSLTFDHRAVDGAPAAKFLQAVCRAVENPGERLIQ